MKTPANARLILVSRIAFCVLFAFVLMLPGRVVADWKVVTHEEREYLSLSNIAKFYGFNLERVGEKGYKLTNMGQTMETSEKSREFFINGLKFILSFPTVPKDGELLVSRIDLTRLIEPVLRPSRIRNARPIRTVVLDAGHGGHDAGARGSTGLEKAFALDTAMRAKTLLERAGYRVVMTRTSDRFVPLHERARIANRYPDAVMISVHYNASSNLAATGIETFLLPPRGVPSHMSDGPSVRDTQLLPGNSRDAENMALATAAHAAMMTRSGMPDRGIKRARFVVLREATIPAVLLEGGFLTNAHDARKVASPAYRQQFALAILRAVQNYQTAILSRSAGPRATPSPSETLMPTHTPTTDENDGPRVIIPREPRTGP